MVELHPVIVEPDADIEAMIPDLVKVDSTMLVKFVFFCSKNFVHESIIDTVVSKIAEKSFKLIVGDQLDPKLKLDH